MSDGTGNSGLGQRAISGLLWGVLGGAVGKFAAFFTQIYLGWVLSHEDFALYAIALSASVVVAGLVNGGTQRILIQRTRRYDEIAFVVLQLAFIFNLAVMLVLCGLALPMAKWFDAPPLAPMLAVMGIAAVIATPGHVLHAKLAVELRFSTTQMLAIWSHGVRQGTTALFAFLGFGPFSFVLPLIVVAVTDNLLAWRAVQQRPTPRSFDRKVALDVLKDSRWVMIGTFSGAMIQNGSNLAVSLFASKATLGVYFFAFQLTFSVAALFGGTLQSIIMPTLVRIADEPARQHQAFVRAIRATALAASAMALALFSVAPPLVHSLWAGKWDEAIIVVQILGLAIPALMVTWIARGSIEARGGWATVTLLSVAEGIGTVTVAAVGAAAGGLPLIAAAVALFKVVAGFTHAVVASRSLGGGAADVLRPLLAPYVAIGVALGVGRVVEAGTALPEQIEIMLATIVTFSVFALVAHTTCRDGAIELRGILAQVSSKLNRTVVGRRS